MQSEDEPREQKEINWRKNVKKEFRLKLSGFCKTRTKESIPEMFNLDIVLAGFDIITDVERATTCTCKFKAPLIYSNCTKIEGHSENMVINGKTI